MKSVVPLSCVVFVLLLHYMIVRVTCFLEEVGFGGSEKKKQHKKSTHLIPQPYFLLSSFLFRIGVFMY